MIFLKEFFKCESKREWLIVLNVVDRFNNRRKIFFFLFNLYNVIYNSNKCSFCVMKSFEF